jgi:plastocyanin
MRLRFSILSILLAAFVVAPGPAQSTSDKPAANNDTPGTEVTGDVNLVLEKSGHPGDESRVVVWLTPLDAVQKIHATSDKNRYRLLQRNKHFEPSLLVVPVGSVVDFPNLDPWFHNVFSLYRGKRFDLGLYQAGAQRSVKFDRPGPSYLFCNIHPEMTGVVLAIDSEFFGVSDKAGHYAIPGVPPGKYLLHVWYENARPEALQELQRTFITEGGNHAIPTISIPVLAQLRSGHKNKYGQDYDPDELKPDY